MSVNIEISTIIICFFSIFFEPDAFYCEAGELSSKANGGVALVKGKKVRHYTLHTHLMVGQGKCM